MADQLFNSEENQDSKKAARVNTLKFISENIAKLSDEELDGIAGGIDGGSTCATFTCTMCTSTRDSDGKEQDA